jgi:DegV family protein with EDD domain
MPNVCILTDSTAQFTRPDFAGHERVYVIPFELETGKRQGDKDPQRAGPFQRLIPPSPLDFSRFYTQLSHKYDSIFVLTISSQLSPANRQALSASVQFNNHATIEVVDSQTIAVGLGLLVQAAAEAAAKGFSLQEIEHLVRARLPHVYVLLCIPELTYLAQAGFMDYSQALVGEMMGMLPVFTIEEGRLTPMEKARTQRHLFESFQDFASEFESPLHIALVRGENHNTVRTRPLRLFVQENFPNTSFSEHSIHPHLAALFGSQCTGLIILEN